MENVEITPSRDATIEIAPFAWRERLAAWWWLPASVAIAFATWPVDSIDPHSGLDPSWQIALHLVARDGLAYGHDVVYTYGPLGFLSVPLLVTGWTAAAGLVFAAVVETAVVAAVLFAARRAFPWPVAILVTYLVAALPGLLADQLVLLVLFGCVWALVRDEPPSQVWLVPLGGAIAAFQLLVKLNGGVIALALLAFTVWRLRPGGWRSEVVLGASFVGALLAFWLVTGNPVGDLPSWLRESAHVVSAYTPAMAYEGDGRGWDYAVAAGLLAVAAVGVAVEARRLGRARGVALCLVAAAFAFVYFKEGFVRHDGHVNHFFRALAIGAIAFAWRGRRLNQAVVLAFSAAAILAIVRTPDYDLGGLYHPVQMARAAADQVRTVADSSERRAAVAAAKTSIRDATAVDAATLRALSGHSVDVVPYETSIVWAYDLPWQPEPALQWHVAYDSHLDALNARALAERGASRVLRELAWPALDGRSPHQEAPATFLALLCHYRDVHVADEWEVLARVAPRCGTPRLLSSTYARADRAVTIPPAPTAQDVVYARVHLPRPLLLQVRLTAFKQLDLPQMILDRERYRFIETDGPLVLRLPAAAGIAPFRGGSVDYSRMSLRHVPSPFRIDFYAVRIAGAGRPPRVGDASLVGDRALRLNGRTIPIEPGAVTAYLDETTTYAGDAVAQGWAVDRARKRAADRVLAFAGGRLVASVPPRIDRPDIAASLGSERARRSGFSLRFRGSDTAAGARIFAVSGSRASELRYPARYAWAGGTKGLPAASLVGDHGLRVAGRRVEVLPGAVSAFVDAAGSADGNATIYGWAADVKGRRPASRILVFAGGRLVAAVAPAIRRPDVARAYRARALERTGYRIAFPLTAAARPVRVFAVAGGRASEAAYPKGYPWAARR